MRHPRRTKIEPTLILQRRAVDCGRRTQARGEERAGRAATVEAPKPDSKAPDTTAAGIEARIDAAKAPSRPGSKRRRSRRAPQLGETKSLVPFKAPAPTAESAAPQPPRAPALRCLPLASRSQPASARSRGSLGVAKLGPAFNATPLAVAPAKEHVADEVKALKDSVAQLRATTKSLSDNLAALKTTVAKPERAEQQDRRDARSLEKGQPSSARSARPQAAAPETTGSITQKQAAVPMVLGDPPTTLKPPIVQG